METVCIGIGSNLADPRAQVEAALRALQELPQTRLLRRSRLYRSAPWGQVEQPEFVNAAALLQTALAPNALLDALLGIERMAGRTRDGSRWGPRVLDLDILLYGGRVIDEHGLRVPHPHLAERAFVLMPLAEVASAANVPGLARVDELLARIDRSSCVALEPDPALAE